MANSRRSRTCAFCGGDAASYGGRLGRLEGPFSVSKNTFETVYVHSQCAIWSPNISQNVDMTLRSVGKEVRRARNLKCSSCGCSGAATGCRVPSCGRCYHLPCAISQDCRFNFELYLMACPEHDALFKNEPGGRASERPGDPLAHLKLSGRRQQPHRYPALEAARQSSRGLKRRNRMTAAQLGEHIDAVKAAYKSLAAELDAQDGSEPDEAIIAAKDAKRLRKATQQLAPSLLAPTTAAPAVVLGHPPRPTSAAGRPLWGLPQSMRRPTPVHTGCQPSVMPQQLTAWRPPAGGFANVGGLADVKRQLKEMVLMPLMYPEVMKQLGIQPPRGILLHGPPGTGKTAIVRALAAECAAIGGSTGATGGGGPKPVALFARKGTDCLGKYAGDAELHLRLLFDMAAAAAPSIIFLDELDGLVPARSVRSSSSDQIFASVVSVMLALMDGLKDRGQVLIIGATNRPDSIDPALRRPGRFDREVYFNLPTQQDRQAILAVHTRSWQPQPSKELLQQLAAATDGWAGADLQSLTAAALMSAVRGSAPNLLAAIEQRQGHPGAAARQLQPPQMQQQQQQEELGDCGSSPQAQQPANRMPSSEPAVAAAADCAPPAANADTAAVQEPADSTAQQTLSPGASPAATAVDHSSMGVPVASSAAAVCSPAPAAAAAGGSLIAAGSAVAILDWPTPGRGFLAALTDFMSEQQRQAQQSQQSPLLAPISLGSPRGPSGQQQQRQQQQPPQPAPMALGSPVVPSGQQRLRQQSPLLRYSPLGSPGVPASVVAEAEAIAAARRSPSLAAARASPAAALASVSPSAAVARAVSEAHGVAHCKASKTPPPATQGPSNANTGQQLDKAGQGPLAEGGQQLAKVREQAEGPQQAGAGTGPQQQDPLQPKEQQRQQVVNSHEQQQRVPQAGGALGRASSSGLPRVADITVLPADWLSALAAAGPPASKREMNSLAALNPAAPLPAVLAPLLLPSFAEVVLQLHKWLLLSVGADQLASAAADVCHRDVGIASEVDQQHSLQFEQLLVQFAAVEELQRSEIGLNVQGLRDSYCPASLARPDNTGHSSNAIATPTTADATRGPATHGQSSSTSTAKGTNSSTQAASRQIPTHGSSCCCYSLLLSGHGAAGQSDLAAAALKLLGITSAAAVHTLSLPGMLLHGDGNVGVGLVAGVREAVARTGRGQLLVLYLPRIELWSLDPAKHNTATSISAAATKPASQQSMHQRAAWHKGASAFGGRNGAMHGVMSSSSSSSESDGSSSKSDSDADVNAQAGLDPNNIIPDAVLPTADNAVHARMHARNSAGNRQQRLRRPPGMTRRDIYKLTSGWGVFEQQLAALPGEQLCVLVLATSQVAAEDLPAEVQQVFGAHTQQNTKSVLQQQPWGGGVAAGPLFRSASSTCATVQTCGCCSARRDRRSVDAGAAAAEVALSAALSRAAEAAVMQFRHQHMLAVANNVVQTQQQPQQQQQEWPDSAPGQQHEAPATAITALAQTSDNQQQQQWHPQLAFDLLNRAQQAQAQNLFNQVQQQLRMLGNMLLQDPALRRAVGKQPKRHGRAAKVQQQPQLQQVLPLADVCLKAVRGWYCQLDDFQADFGAAVRDIMRAYAGGSSYSQAAAAAAHLQDVVAAACREAAQQLRLYDPDNIKLLKAAAEVRTAAQQQQQQELGQQAVGGVLHSGVAATDAEVAAIAREVSANLGDADKDRDTVEQNAVAKPMATDSQVALDQQVQLDQVHAELQALADYHLQRWKQSQRQQVHIGRAVAGGLAGVAANGSCNGASLYGAVQQYCTAAAVRVSAAVVATCAQKSASDGCL